MDLWTRFQGPDINDDEFWSDEKKEKTQETEADLSEFLVPVDEESYHKSEGDVEPELR